MLETQWYYIASFILGLFGFYLAIDKRMGDKIKAVYDKVESFGDKILDKLEYHERHDDQRFSQVNNDIWQMRLDAAKKDQNKAINGPRREADKSGI